MAAGQPLHIPWAKGNGSLSTFSVFEESLPAVWAGFFYVLLRHDKK